MDTAQDAHHEFFREETRRWFVHLVEAAVARPGVLTFEIVDRPSADGTPKAVIGRLQQRVEPGRPLLLGLGFENLNSFDVGNGTARERAGPLGRVRMLAAGGAAVGDRSAVGSRLYTAAHQQPAWAPVHTIDFVLPEVDRAALQGLRDAWLAGPELGYRRHVAGPIGTPLVLGALVWLPRDSGPEGARGSWVNGEVDERVFSGGVTFRRTNESITIFQNGEAIPFDAYAHPAWLARLTFQETVP
jgi:hypothetical protein